MLIFVYEIYCVLSFCSWNLLHVDFFSSWNLYIDFLLVKLILTRKLVACWFLIVGIFACWFLFVKLVLSCFFFLRNLYFDFSPREIDFVHGTCCMLIFVPDVYCILIFIFMKIVHRFSILVKLILFKELVSRGFLFVEVAACRFCLRNFYRTDFRSWN